MANLALAATLALSGCASTTTLSSSTSSTTVASSVAEPARPARAPHCPPLTRDRPLERNLTVAFAERAYLLESGELCRPAPYPPPSNAEAPAPAAPAAAGPVPPLAWPRRAIHDGR